jgi:dynein heavy chain
LYTPVPTYESLKKALEDKLAEYNETNAVMDLVLFQQAMEHVTRISRIIDLPRWVERVG